MPIGKEHVLFYITTLVIRPGKKTFPDLGTKGSGVQSTGLGCVTV